MAGHEQDNFDAKPSPGEGDSPVETDGPIDLIDLIVGIDLGTTNSLVAVADARGPRVLRLGERLADHDQEEDQEGNNLCKHK